MFFSILFLTNKKTNESFFSLKNRRWRRKQKRFIFPWNETSANRLTFIYQINLISQLKCWPIWKCRVFVEWKLYQNVKRMVFVQRKDFGCCPISNWNWPKVWSSSLLELIYVWFVCFVQRNEEREMKKNKHRRKLNRLKCNKSLHVDVLSIGVLNTTFSDVMQIDLCSKK